MSEEPPVYRPLGLEPSPPSPVPTMTPLGPLATAVPRISGNGDGQGRLDAAGPSQSAVEAGLLAAADTPEKLAAIADADLGPYFVAWGDVYKFLVTFAAQYGALPPSDVIATKFEDWEPPTGPFDYWLAEATRYRRARAVQTILRDHLRLIEHQPEAAAAAIIEKLATLAAEAAQPTGLPIHNAKEIADATPEKVTWVAAPWIAAGAITEVDGKIKSSGKTTWLTHLSRKVLDGELFINEYTAKGPVIYLTEQQPVSFRQALQRADLLGREDFFVVWWHETRGRDWPDIVRGTVAHALNVGAKLLVVDTLSEWAGLKDEQENSAAAAMAALAPLKVAAAKGLAVAVARHERKSPGDVGDAARGSSAFAGGVDVVLSIRRGEGATRQTIRVIHALSRFQETPAERVIELTDKGYISLGTQAAVAQQEAAAAILAAAPATEEDALSTADLLEAAGNVKRTSAQDALKRLYETGQLQRKGKGKAGDPYRYWEGRS